MRVGRLAPAMTSTTCPRAPGGFRALRDDRVRHHRPSRAADRVAGDALLAPDGDAARHHDRARLSQEGATTPANPACRAAVLRSDRQRPRRPADGARSGHGLRGRPGHRGQRRSATRASPRRSCRRSAGWRCRAHWRSCCRGTRTASTSMCGPSASTCGAGATRPRSRNCSTRTWRRCAPATARSPNSRIAGRRRRSLWDDRMDELGRGYATAVIAVVGPDGFPFALRVPIPPGPGGAADPSRGRTGGRALGARPGLPRRPRSRTRFHVAAQFPGAWRPHERRPGWALAPQRVASAGWSARPSLRKPSHYRSTRGRSSSAGIGQALAGAGRQAQATR